MALVERVLFSVIKTGLDWFKAKPERFERWLRDECDELSDEEIAHALLYFAGGTTADGEAVEARPPALIHGYARTGGPFPCWALVLGAEKIFTNYLGDDASLLDSDGEYTYDPETGKIVDPKIRRMQYTFNVLVHVDHPDVCSYYYHLLKFIVSSSDDVLRARDVDELDFSGQDLAPDPRYLPSDLFTRLFQIVVVADETWAEAPWSEFQPIEPGPKTLTGMHLDDDGSQTPDGAEGDEKALVTTYTES